MNSIRAPRAGITALGVVLALGLAGCSSDGTAAPTNGPTGTPTDAVLETPTIVGGDDFCDIAIESLAAEDDVNKASEDLTAAMTSGDIDALHAASQAVLDNSVVATRFYGLGAAATDDQATKDAFNGLSRFVTEYSIAMGEAGVDAATVPEFVSSITTLFTNPELQPLLQSAPGWATTARDFTVEHCGL